MPITFEKFLKQNSEATKAFVAKAKKSAKKSRIDNIANAFELPLVRNVELKIPEFNSLVTGYTQLLKNSKLDPTSTVETLDAVSLAAVDRFNHQLVAAASEMALNEQFILHPVITDVDVLGYSDADKADIVKALAADILMRIARVPSFKEAHAKASNTDNFEIIQGLVNRALFRHKDINVQINSKALAQIYLEGSPNYKKIVESDLFKKCATLEEYFQRDLLNLLHKAVLKITELVIDNKGELGKKFFDATVPTLRALQKDLEKMMTGKTLDLNLAKRSLETVSKKLFTFCWEAPTLKFGTCMKYLFELGNILQNCAANITLFPRLNLPTRVEAKEDIAIPGGMQLQKQFILRLLDKLQHHVGLVNLGLPENSQRLYFKCMVTALDLLLPEVEKIGTGQAFDLDKVAECLKNLKDNNAIAARELDKKKVLTDKSLWDNLLHSNKRQLTPQEKAAIENIPIIDMLLETLSNGLPPLFARLVTKRHLVSQAEAKAVTVVAKDEPKAAEVDKPKEKTEPEVSATVSIVPAKAKTEMNVVTKTDPVNPPENKDVSTNGVTAVSKTRTPSPHSARSSSSWDLTSSQDLEAGSKKPLKVSTSMDRFFDKNRPPSPLSSTPSSASPLSSSQTQLPSPTSTDDWVAVENGKSLLSVSNSPRRTRG